MTGAAGRAYTGRMKIPPIVTYTVLRLLAFLVPLGIMWFISPIMREFWWLTAIFAALIGMSISILFLRKPLSGASAGIYERRAARTDGPQNTATQDADAEDSVLDSTSDETRAPREG